MKRDESYDVLIKPNLDDVRQMMFLGKTIEAIAHHFGISRHAFYELMRSEPELLDAIEQGMEKQDAFIASKRMELANGATVTEERYDAKGNLIERRTKKLAPDTAALNAIERKQQFAKARTAVCRYEAETRKLQTDERNLMYMRELYNNVEDYAELSRVGAEIERMERLGADLSEEDAGQKLLEELRDEESITDVL